METTEVHGLNIAYERAGDGPPLVLLHGYVGDGPTTWRPQLEGLGDEFTVIAWDAPGAGRSSDPPEAMGLADLPPAEFVGTLLPTMFSEATPPESVDAFCASMLGFHPVGFRAMARASAENLRDALPHVTVPTLLVYGDQDVRAPERRRGPPPVHPRVDPGCPARRRPHLHPGGPGGVQPDRPELPPHQPREG
jgi:pimeloyl-ACP methyl ester carboxylesterase